MENEYTSRYRRVKSVRMPPTLRSRTYWGLSIDNTFVSALPNYAPLRSIQVQVSTFVQKRVYQRIWIASNQVYTYIHATHLIMLGTEFEFWTSEIYSQCTDGIRYLYMSNDSPMVRVLFGYICIPRLTTESTLRASYFQLSQFFHPIVVARTSLTI